MQIEETLEKLFAMKQFSIKLGLDNIIKLMEYLGNPQRELKTFHIAGSNGKGSTASILSSILIEMGFKTGLYTSPHLVKFNERIRVNGKMIPDEFLMNFIQKHEQFIRIEEPTFFEITTAMAFEYFREQKVDFAIIETGLGGRLDATNVLNPLSVLITSISEEHSRILGESIEKIAGEKAGIIKKETPVFLGKMLPEAETVFVNRCQELRAPLCKFNEYFDSQSGYGILSAVNRRIHLYETQLNGEHQLRNAGLAIRALLERFPGAETSSILRGIENVIPNSGLQCRYEVFNQNPKIIFDAAHNAEGIDAFVHTFEKEHNDYSSRELITGMMNDKDIPLMLKKLKPFFDRFYFAAVPNERSETPENLRRFAESVGINGDIVGDPAELINEKISEHRSGCTVVLGSIYLLGEIKKNLSAKKIT